MYSDRYVCPILTKFGFYQQIFIKVHNIRFYGNTSSGSHSATCEQADTTKIIGDFGDCVNAPKIKVYYCTQHQTLPIWISKYNPHPHNPLLRSILILSSHSAMSPTLFRFPTKFLSVSYLPQACYVSYLVLLNLIFLKICLRSIIYKATHCVIFRRLSYYYFM